MRFFVMLLVLFTSTLCYGTSPETRDVAGQGIELAGMFRYLGDASLFRDCRTGKRFPVAMEGAYLALERAYLNSGIEPGAELKVELRGRYLERPASDGNHTEVMLIVDEYHAIVTSQDCEPTTHASLTDTYWKLLEVAGEKVVMPPGARDAHLILAAAESRVRGFSGCNNFFGSYHASGDRLSFSDLGATMMACPDTMETERVFLLVLEETDRAVVSGLCLELFAGERLLARFEAIYL
jgi:heat shock protein HslJ